MKDTPQERAPAQVLGQDRAKPAGDIRTRWGWVEPEVWTERMLTALETGVKEGVWFSLIQRWPNAYFAAQGLFTMSVAHVLARQSLGVH